MKLSGWMLRACLAAVSVVVACSSSPSSVAPGADPDAEGASDDDAGNGAGTTRPDAGATDAHPDDAPEPVSNEGWTQESQTSEILLKTSFPPSGLAADPVTPRKLLVRIFASKTLAIVWNNGSFGMPLLWTGGAGPVFDVASGNGGGFASDGLVYDYIAFTGGNTPVQVAHQSAGNWTWQTVSPTSSWPPRRVLFMPGAPLRVFLQTDGNLVEMTAAGTPSFPLEYTQSVSLSPDRTTYLLVSGAHALRRCTLATGACDDVAATGFADGETLGDVWIDPLDASRVYVTTFTGAALHLYAATDGGTAFTSVPLPSGMVGRPVYSPGHPGEIAVNIPAGDNTPPGIQVTTDRGVTWKSLPLPTTPITDVAGIAIDAAGTLFLARNGTLYSRSVL